MNELQDKVSNAQKMWLLLYLIYSVTMSFNLIFQQAQRWGNSLAQMAGSGPGYLADNIITPYIHIMVFHVPTMIRNNGSLKYFSGQGNFFRCKILEKASQSFCQRLIMTFKPVIANHLQIILIKACAFLTRSRKEK